MPAAAFVVWGPELSPFLLKLEALLVASRLPLRRLPRDAGRVENLRTTLMLENAKRSGRARRPPASDALDELPLVPFLITPAGDVLHDSSALAEWLDEEHRGAREPFVPADAALGFVTRLVDEAFDEFGLYMVHHNRWKLAARDNDHPGRRLAREYARQIPPGVSRLFADWFERRQVRRLPYLFSVAPRGYREDGLAPSLTPPAREGFPPTHDLLESSWQRYLGVLEKILVSRRFLLGERFTLADASVYGQLSMNLTDTAAARRLKELAPRTFAWLEEIREGRHAAATGPLVLGEDLAPLLDTVLETFVPLMKANAAAHATHKARGATLFNEAAFDAGTSLYDGELLGHAYRSVAKTFQVRVWRDLCAHWVHLRDDEKIRIRGLLPHRDLDAAFTM